LQVWLILGGVFVIDATVTLLRRILRGDRWVEPHRLHAYQRLAGLWRAHLPVLVVAITINIFWLFPWACFAAARPDLANVALVASLLPIAILALAFGAGRRAG
jgi:Fuc2NAc and GlcNAc transferase